MTEITNHLKFCCMVFTILYRIVQADIVILRNDLKIDIFNDVELGILPPQFDGFEGAILNADPPDGCSPIAQPPSIGTPLNWFVLISGNFCDYGTKVVYAELAGYSAAVIYSLRGNNIGIHRKSSDYYTNISAVLVRTSTGIIIKENYLYTIDKRYKMVFYLNHTFDAISFLAMMVAALAGFCVIIMLSLLIIKCVQRSNDVRNSRLRPRYLEQLQTSRFQTGDPYETCAICLEDFKSNDMLRILPCCHGYHTNCIDQWLTENRRICPICKKQITFEGESHQADYNFDTEIRSERTPLLSGTEAPVSRSNYSILGISPGNLSNDTYHDNLSFIPYNAEPIITGNATSVDIEPNEENAS